MHFHPFSGLKFSLFALFFIIWSGCAEKEIGISGVPASLSFTSLAGGGAAAVAAAQQTIQQGNARVVIDEASFVIRRVKLKALDAHEEDFKTGSFVVKLNLDGTKNTVALANLPAGTYDRIKFDFHKLDASEIAAIDLNAAPEFAEFIQDNGLSIIIKGTFDDNVTDGIAPQNFVFKSRLNEAQEYFFSPGLEIKEGAVSVNMDLSIDMSQWFVVNGQIVSPLDARFSSDIEKNIKQSGRKRNSS